MRNRSLLLFGLTIVLSLIALNGCNDSSLQSIQPSGIGIGFNPDGKLNVGTLIANGYRSLGFPVGTSTLVVQGASTDYPVSLVVVNNSSESKTVTVGAEFSSSNANVTEKRFSQKQQDVSSIMKFRHPEFNIDDSKLLLVNFRTFKQPSPVILSCSR